MPPESETPAAPILPQPVVKATSSDKSIRKTIFVICGIVLGFMLIGSGFWWFFSERPATSVETSFLRPSPQPQANLLTWDDPAGFTFKYPDGLNIDKHDEDQENYAHVELIDPQHPGSVIVWAKDLPLNKQRVVVKDETEWVMNDAVLSEGNIVDTTLGAEVAKKILLSSPEQLFVGTIYDGVLWYIEGKFTDKVFWSDVHKIVTDSFTFKPLAQTGETVDTEIAVDEEEVIE